MTSTNVLAIMAPCSILVITTTQLHSSKPSLRFCTGLNPALSVQEVCNDENH